MVAPLDGEFASLYPSPQTSGLARRQWFRGALLDRKSAFLHLSPPILTSSFAPPGGVRGAGAGRQLLLPYWTRSTPPFAPPGGVRGAGAGRLLLLPHWTRSTPSFALSDGMCEVKRLLLLPYWSDWTRSKPSFAPPGGVRGAGAGRQLLLPYWTRSTPPFAPPGGVRGAGAGRLLLLPHWTRSTPSFALSDGMCEVKRLLLLPYWSDWTRSKPSFAPPGGVRGAGAGRQLLLPYWTRSTPPFAPPDGVRGAGHGRRPGQPICGGPEPLTQTVRPTGAPERASPGATGPRGQAAHSIGSGQL